MSKDAPLIEQSQAFGPAPASLRGRVACLLLGEGSVCLCPALTSLIFCFNFSPTTQNLQLSDDDVLFGGRFSQRCLSLFIQFSVTSRLRYSVRVCQRQQRFVILELLDSKF